MRTDAVFTLCLSLFVKYLSVTLLPSSRRPQTSAKRSSVGVATLSSAVTTACFGTPPRPNAYPGSATYTDPAGS